MKLPSIELERRNEMRSRLSVITAVLTSIVLSFLFLVIPLRAQFVRVYVVKNPGDTVVAGACGNGTGNSTADCSLRGAILAANAIGSGTISFAIPTCQVCVINLASALPDLSANNTFINGPGVDRLIVRRTGAGGNYRIFNVTAMGTVGISGMTITNGFLTSGNGGGIANALGTLNVSNSTIRSNQVSAGSLGGGIANIGGTLNVTNCLINSNRAGSGGNIFNGSGGTLTVVNSTITGGVSSLGGGISNVGGSGGSVTQVINSTLSGNFADTRGGAIYNDGGDLIFVNSSTLSQNVVSGSGAQGGGGIYNSGVASVLSSIIASNGASSGPDVSGTFVSQGFNLIGSRDGSMGFEAATDQTGTIALPLDPLLDGLDNYGGTAFTYALRVGSPAIDKGSSIGLIGVGVTTDQRGLSFRRTFDSTAIPNATGGDGTDIGAFELQSKSPADFDGDNKTDISIFRPAPGEWWYLKSSNGGNAATNFGQSSDKITPGDFTGDGKTDIAFFRPSNGSWFVLRSEDFSFFSFPFGTSTDIPTVGDFDGDGTADPTVFRPSDTNWYISRSSGGTTIQQFGANGDAPVPADYDGDGKADIAIYRPSLGQWWVNRSSNGTTIALQFGASTDKPARGDYTGDGKADIAFWRPSTGFWFVLRSEDSSFFAFPFGVSTDIPAPGDYDGDGKFDAAVFRPSDTNWYIQRSTGGNLILQFGIAGDRPVPNAFVP